MAEKQTESYNTHLAHSVKSLFPPSWVEIVMYLLSGSILLSVLNYRAFTSSLGTNSGVNQTTINSYLHDKIGSASDFISRPLEGRTSSILFWAFLGSFIYMAIWVIQNVIINIENDVQAGDFTGMQNKERRQMYWHSVISSKVFFGCSLLVLVIYLISLVNFFIPLMSRIFGLAISDFRFVKSSLSIIVSVFLTALFLYLLLLALRSVTRSWHWIIGNF